MAGRNRCRQVQVTHTQQGGQANDDGNDEIGRSGERGAGRHGQVAMAATIAQRTQTLVLAFVLVIDARGAVTARPPLALVHVATRGAVLGLAFGATAAPSSDTDGRGEKVCTTLDAGSNSNCRKKANKI